MDILMYVFGGIALIVIVSLLSFGFGFGVFQIIYGRSYNAKTFIEAVKVYLVGLFIFLSLSFIFYY